MTNATIDTTALKSLIQDVNDAAEGDSNDSEIAVLRDASETALQLLGRDLDDEGADDIGRAAARCRRAADGDSNDEEIEAYQDLLDEALTGLGLDVDGNPRA